MSTSETGVFQSMDKRSKQYIESKKVPKVEKEKKSEDRKIFEQRIAYYLPFHKKGEVSQQVELNRQVEVVKHDERCISIVSDWATQASDKASRIVSFLWKKKSAIGIGVMLAFAGRLGAAEGRSLGGSTALRPRDRSNATGLPCRAGRYGRYK